MKCNGGFTAYWVVYRVGPNSIDNCESSGTHVSNTYGSKRRCEHVNLDNSVFIISYLYTDKNLKTKNVWLS